MRRLFIAEEAWARGVTPAALRWGEQTGRWRRIDLAVYGVGPDEPTRLDRARAAVLATGGVASGHLAGALHGLDSVGYGPLEVTVPPGSSNHRKGVRRRHLDPERVVRVGGVPCTDGMQTLIDLAASVDDLVWEQALESAVRRRLLAVDDLDLLLARAAGTRGVARVRRVLALRPERAAPTESLLETLMVQLARAVPDLPPPTRQLDVFDEHGGFAGRLDLCWPELGLFIELDGEHHKGQPVYDASRETAVVAATGWLCGRFTWTEVTRHAAHTRRRLTRLVERARQRPVR